jgi:uncharacterized protein (TIGR00730 family)
MHKWVTIKYFFVRKVLLAKYSFAFVVMPGGLGTMDEFFEILTLIQTGIIRNFPVVIIGKKYFEPMLEMLNKMVHAGTISEKDLHLLLITDDIEETSNYIQKYVIENFHVTRANPSPLFRQKILGRK